MSRADVPTAKHDANQFSRVLGILDALDLDGNEAIVVADVREAVERLADRNHYRTEPHDIVSVDAAEWTTLARFCDEMAVHGDVADRARARQLADVAEERLRGGRE